VTSKSELERRIADLERRVTILEFHLSAVIPPDPLPPQRLPEEFIKTCTVKHPCRTPGFGPCNGWPRTEERGNDAMTGLMDDTGTIVRGTE
jgi:hypothetical protein